MLFLEVALLIEEILECCEIFRRAAHLDPFRGLALGNVVANLHLTLVGEWLDLAAGGSTAVVSCRITRFSRSKLRGRAIILDQKNVKVSAYSPHPPPHMKRTNNNTPKRCKSGMTLLELTVVILVHLSVRQAKPTIASLIFTSPVSWPWIAPWQRATGTFRFASPIGKFSRTHFY